MSETKKRKIECEIDEQSIIAKLPEGEEAECHFEVDQVSGKLILFARDNLYWMQSEQGVQTLNGAWESGLSDITGDIEDDEAAGEWELDAKAIEQLEKTPFNDLCEHCYLFKDGVAPSTAAELCQSHWLKFAIPIVVTGEANSEESDNEK